MIGVDWAVDLAEARRTLGPGVPVSGNVDPLVLMGPEHLVAPPPPFPPPPARHALPVSHVSGQGRWGAAPWGEGRGATAL